MQKDLLVAGNMPLALGGSESADANRSRLLMRQMTLCGFGGLCRNFWIAATMEPALLCCLAAAVMMGAGKVRRCDGFKLREKPIKRKNRQVGKCQ